MMYVYIEDNIKFHMEFLQYETIFNKTMILKRIELKCTF